MRGYCGIGIINSKREMNLGALWRAACCLGADFIFTVGARYRHQCSDTTKAYKHIPYWRFGSFDDFKKHLPYDCILVGVEISDKARPLETFIHPERAIYLLGPEDGSLPDSIMEQCQHVVQFSSRFCMNVAVAGAIVLYDRQAKKQSRFINGDPKSATPKIPSL